MGDLGQPNGQPAPPSQRPSDEEMLEALPSAVRDAYDSAIADKKIFLYDTSVIVESIEHGVPYQIHVLPEFNKKPPPSKELPDLEHKRESDPFSPPFVPSEYIGELTGYYVFLNKYNLLPSQFMLVTQDWKSQVGPLEEEDLFTAWKILDALRQKGQDLLCFGNIGQRSGASQPHRHLQFMPIPLRKTVDGSQEVKCIPAEEHFVHHPPSASSEPQFLPLPYHQTFIPLPSKPASSVLYAAYTAQLALLPPSITSHNILLTSAGLHVVPRAERDTLIPLPSSPPSPPSDVSPPVWKASTNALGFAGWFFVEPGKELVLRDFGAARMLCNAGVLVGKEGVNGQPSYK